MNHETVLRFISRFTGSGKYQQVATVFTSGCCYWFAKILEERFKGLEPLLMYDKVLNHFGTMIDGRVYDVTGDVTIEYSWIPWCTLTENDVSITRITRDCIMF